MRDLFGDWGVSLENFTHLFGYRGVGSGFGSSEGKGLYISKTMKTAKFFGNEKGKIIKIEFEAPVNSFLVDNELLHILLETKESEKPIKTKDSKWLKYSKKATRETLKNGKWDTDIAGEKLTNLLIKDGYDSVYVKQKNDEWIVLFYPKIFGTEKIKHGNL